MSLSHFVSVVLKRNSMSVSIIKGFSTFFVHGFLLYSRLPTESPNVKVAWPWTNCALGLNTQTLPDTVPSRSVRPPYIKHGFLSLNSYAHEKDPLCSQAIPVPVSPFLPPPLRRYVVSPRNGCPFHHHNRKAQGFSFPHCQQVSIWAEEAQGAVSLTRKSIQPWLATDVKVLTLLIPNLVI